MSTLEIDLADIDIADPALWEARFPHEELRRLRSEDRVHWHPEPGGNAGFWALTRHEDVVAVSRNAKLYLSGHGSMLEELTPEQMDARRSLIETDGRAHTRLRRIVSPLFTPRAVEAYEARARELAQELLDAAIPLGEFDWVLEVAQPLPIRVIIGILGAPVEDTDRLIELSNQMIAVDDPDYAPPPEMYREGMDPKMLPFGSPASLEVFEYGRRLADLRRADPRDDLVTRLINAEAEGERLSDEEYVNFFQLLILAGNETTRNSISHGMHAFIEHPDQLDRLAADPSLMDSAVEEVLRWASPVLYMRRTAAADHELHGKAIRAGDKLGLWYASSNYDEHAFPDPYRFDIGRDPNPHDAFGAGGVHFCLGAWLARMEIRVLLEEVLRRDLRLEQTGPVRRLRSNFVHGVKSLPVRVVRGSALA